MTVLTAAAVTAFIGLGRWQWHRAAQASALQARFAAGSDGVRAADDGSLATLPRYAQVRVSGRYDEAHQFLLDNMSVHGMPGYEVLTPLLLSDGHALIVNRGWIPIAENRRELPDLHLGAPAAQTPVGRLDALPVPGIALGHSAPSPGPEWPKLTSFPTMQDLSHALGRPLEQRQLLLNANQPLGFLRDWQPPGMGPAQHLSYAFQWWGFAATVLFLYGYLNRQRKPRVKAVRRGPAVRSGTGAEETR